MTKNVSLDTPVGQLVVEDPARARVLEQYGIDYCCGGRKTLAVAIAERGADPATVVKQLGDSRRLNADDLDPSRLTMTELADHIERTHHVYLRAELPRLRQLMDKVLEKHGDAHPWLNELRSVFRELEGELETHMEKEEQILFPMVKEMERVQHAADLGFTVDSPITVLEHEHEHAAEALRRFRDITHGFTPPTGACNSFRALLDGLHTLELDLHQHIHKENNILFVRALAVQGGD